MSLNEQFKTRANWADRLRGGVIMDVVTVEQAQIAERAGAVAVMALERIPADMRNSGHVCRMSDPHMIKSIMDAVKIPVMAKCRIGHTAEAQILQALDVACIDESEVLTPADKVDHVTKNDFSVPFVCGTKNLGEALRRIHEGVAMLRTKGEAGTGDVSEAVYHVKLIRQQIAKALSLKTDAEVEAYAKELNVPLYLLKQLIADGGKFPVVNFGCGGIASPADAALVMQLGSDGVFVGSGIFKSKNPEKLARAIVNAVKHYDNPLKLLEVSTDVGQLMYGITVHSLAEDQKLANRHG